MVLILDDAFIKNDADDTSSGVITSAGYKVNVADGGGDVAIEFQQGGTSAYVMGLDDSVTGNVFKIHSGTALADTSDFTLDASGNVVINGDLTVTGGDITLGTSLILSGGNTTSLNLRW